MINFGAGLAKIAGILKMGAGLPAIAGVVLAAAAGTYFVAPQVFTSTGEPASPPAQISAPIDGGVTEPQSAPDEAPATEIASAEPVDEPAGVDNWVMPSFDVLRVEPDGSTVIAGKAEPGTTLNIMNGETVIASTQVGPSGDFAAILDEPLPPGDYQLTLEIADEAGETRRSEEIATISIPRDADGELLAMVTTPGKASRIITQPEAPTTGEPVEMASAEPSGTDDDQAAAPVAPEISAPEIAAPETTAPETESAETGDAPANAPVAQEPAVTETPALPDASSLLTTTAPEIAADGEAQESADTSSQSEAEQEVAMVTPETAAAETEPALPLDAAVRVDAVEIEGDRLFVAGSATPGSPVRVSADGVVIGMEKADDTGRFIVEAITELAVGDHIISADLMDSAGQEVLLRATVPFNRPEGDNIAAVSPSEDASVEEPAEVEIEVEVMARQDGLILPDIASLSKMREESSQALSRLEQMMSATEATDSDVVSDAYVDAIAKLKAAANADLPEGSSDEAMAMAQSMRAQAQAALAALMPPVSAGTDQSDTASGAGVIPDLGKLGERLKQAEMALSEPAQIAVAAANTPDPAAVAEEQTTEPRTIVQAPLASTPGAVIIRRGDTLWQISRRTYGQGVRYTTIYVANRSQIQNPDRIKPGQVFSVPEKPLENAEELHKQLLDPSRNP